MDAFGLGLAVLAALASNRRSDSRLPVQIASTRAAAIESLWCSVTIVSPLSSVLLSNVE
jgi:hypothetical protein